MSNDSQPRDQLGRYGEAPRTDPGELALAVGETDLSDPNEGTFEFPPEPRTTADAVRFWSRVEVPENVLFAVQAAYNARRNNRIMVVDAEWVVANPMPTQEWKVEDWKERRAANTNGRMAEEDAKFPPTVNPTWLRPLVRVAKMYNSVGHLGTDAQRQILALRVRMPDGQSYRIRDLIASYRLLNLLPHMVDKERQIAVQDIVARQFRLVD